MSKFFAPSSFAGLSGKILSVGIFALALGLALGQARGAQKETSKSKVAAKPLSAKDAAKAKEKERAKKEKERAAKTPFDPSHPVMLLDGVRCQVHRDGLLRQDIKALNGRYDEKVKILDLDKLEAKFIDQGTTVAAQISCGAGRVWTSDRPSEQIAAHDMLLQKTVRLQTRDRWLLQTPEMRYSAADSSLHSNKGYQRQIPMKSGYMIGKGDGFDIKLLMEKNTFQFWREYGNPAEMRKSEKPVLHP